MKLFVAFAVIILSASALSLNDHWENFKVKHGKAYKNPIEERVRFSVFQSNLKLINEHNAKYEQGLVGYTMAINQFADITPEEFKAKLGMQAKNIPNIKKTPHVQDVNAEVPDSIDWRQKGAVLGVKDQGDCGSCWAFSTTDSLEGQNYIINGKSVGLSEQELLDCSSDYGNGDCEEGGLMTNAFEYIEDNGIESESSYPYTGRQGTCRRSASKSELKIKGYKEPADNEEALRQAVGTVGPISAAIYAEPIQFYNSGIFNSKQCVNNVNYLDHGILVVGYGEENNTPYWIIKNSWGASWGEQGYFRLQRNAKLCGLALMTSYPVL
ncbi:cathepsin L-like proteinase isoform X3 [Diabrotica virgifera virgifera]|uniref:Cathepsin L1-like n=1 Tax=Diabrotica virgifera virgifera TaxID=50390 RepID=A0ABM5JNR8_DIAVI|nr:cathepsin L-like proteinase isoform X3 [Diabrotica virgifera virgifera]